MTDKTHDAGVTQVLLDRLNNQRLPHTLEIKERVEAGESLSEYDLRFLDEVFADAGTPSRVSETRGAADPSL